MSEIISEQSTTKIVIDYCYSILLVVIGLQHFLICSLPSEILLTILVTVASGERSFSKLKSIKTYLRSVIH